MSVDQENSHWISCPVCGNKTRTKLLEDTELYNFPLFCPKCKRECLINAAAFKITVLKNIPHNLIHHRARRIDAEPMTL